LVTAYVALLRAVNVGRRKLLMGDLEAIGDELGLGDARTFIASGNLLFTSAKSEATLRKGLEQRLGKHMAAEVPVMVRTAEEMAKAAAANPFPGEPGNRVYAIFFNDRPTAETIAGARNVTDERLALGAREIYVHYPTGMGQSKLKIPAADKGTARNMNSVAKMAALLADLR
jgi:uncharacterized protein (DUF1697 family)